MPSAFALVRQIGELHLPLTMTELAAILQEFSRPKPDRVLATLVTVTGSSYRRPGARLLVDSDGRRIGSISGGCLEADVLARAQHVASTGLAELVTYDTTSENDLVWGVGLGCHGVVQVLIEKLPPAPPWVAAVATDQQAHRPTSLAVVWQAADPRALGTRLASELASTPPDSAPDSAPGVFFNTVHAPTRLFVFGAGDDAQPLVVFAKTLGWHVTVADPRAEFASAARFPAADTLVLAPADTLVSHAAPPPEALAVVMTHRYIHDVPILRELLARPLRYVGLLGPRQRAERILDELRRDGTHFTDDQLARFHAPVGLDLGAETPAEVALSILAEMRATLASRDARPLRHRTRPIHG